MALQSYAGVTFALQIQSELVESVNTSCNQFNRIPVLTVKIKR